MSESGGEPIQDWPGNGMILYFAPGTCARVPMIALEEAAQDFTTKVVAFRAAEHRSTDYLALNPKAKVPTLVVDGRALTENVAILTYLAARLPEARLLPVHDDLLDNARVLADLSFCSSGLHPLVTRLRLPGNFCMLPGAAKNVWTIAAEAMAPNFALIDQRLAVNEWWYGEQWSAIDAYVYWVWFRVVGSNFPVDAYPHYAAHAARMEQRPATRRALDREAAGQRELEDRDLALQFRSVNDDDSGTDNPFLVPTR